MAADLRTCASRTTHTVRFPVPRGREPPHQPSATRLYASPHAAAPTDGIIVSYSPFSSESSAAPTDTRRRPDRAPVAVVGIGCRLPGGVDNAQSYWDALVGGHDALVDIPA